MFLINSRYSLFSAILKQLLAWGHPFSRSYGVNLPSSFSIIVSNALVCSTYPPESVYGTVINVVAISRPAFTAQKILLSCTIYTGVTIHWLRNINLIPIDYCFRTHLRGRLTLFGKPWIGNLGFSAGVLLSLLYVTYVSICTSSTSTQPHSWTSSACGTFRYRLKTIVLKPISSVCVFIPVTFSAQRNLSRQVSCNAFFKGWLLSGQPPCCLGFYTTFLT